jgi:hypothetical protein
MGKELDDTRLLLLMIKNSGGGQKCKPNILRRHLFDLDKLIAFVRKWQMDVHRAKSNKKDVKFFFDFRTVQLNLS